LQQVEKKRIEITKKHYRIFYDQELEKNKNLFPKDVFQKYEIKRG